MSKGQSRQFFEVHVQLAFSAGSFSGWKKNSQEQVQLNLWQPKQWRFCLYSWQFNRFSGMIFFLDSYSKGYCANSVSTSLQHLHHSNSYFVNHKTTPKKPPATQTYEDLVAACQMWAEHRCESNHKGSLLSRARDVHLLFGREFTACNFSVSITIIIVNYYHSKVNYYHSRAHHVTCK